jgi:polyhydroxyalkanoate synthesis regulator protein
MMMGQGGVAAEEQKPQAPSKDELQSLKDQLSSMQEKLDRIAK